MDYMKLIEDNRNRPGIIRYVLETKDGFGTAWNVLRVELCALGLNGPDPHQATCF